MSLETEVYEFERRVANLERELQRLQQQEQRLREQHGGIAATIFVPATRVTAAI